MNNLIGKCYNQEVEFLYINHLLYAGCGRFLKYPNTDDILLKIVNIMNDKFPKWRENKYLKNQSKIYKLICNIFIRNKKFELNLYKLFRKIKNA